KPISDNSAWFFCAASPTRSHTPKPNTETLQTKRVVAPLAAALATEPSGSRVGEEAEDNRKSH
ncbi:hypothetical protein, partial [Escherichia coli]|uniref:hypothetical protein n=1 Tax=Escherichia coli TaxID=562 RepID=UPI001BB47F38